MQQAERSSASAVWRQRHPHDGPAGPCKVAASFEHGAVVPQGPAEALGLGLSVLLQRGEKVCCNVEGVCGGGGEPPADVLDDLDVAHVLGDAPAAEVDDLL